jgi:hypothetical protein
VTRRRTVTAVLTCVVLGSLVTVGCGDSSSAASEYCEQIARIDALDVFSDPAPAQVEHDLGRLLALSRRAAAVAPRSIRTDARAAALAQVQFNALYRAHGWRSSPTVTDPAFVALAGDQHLAQVYFRLERYQIRACDADGTPAPPSPAPA